jgi:crossover junction endodeoxyribonuclease RuvC
VTGWGLVGGSPTRARLLGCDVIRLGSPGQGFGARLGRLHDEFSLLVDRLHPTCAAVESPFHGPNARSVLQLAHARGVILAVLAGAGVEVAEYTPAAVKKSVTGNGRASKAQVRAMVGRLLDPLPREGPTDLSDALAVALCHVACSGVFAAVNAALARAPIAGVRRPRSRWG